MRAALVLALLLPLPALAQSDRPGLSMTGDARMGLVWSDRRTTLGPRENGLRLSSRARLHFHFMGETDGGTRFGFNISTDRDTGRPTGGSVFVGQ
jgi:hypothetical protein